MVQATDAAGQLSSTSNFNSSHSFSHVVNCHDAVRVDSSTWSPNPNPNDRIRFAFPHFPLRRSISLTLALFLFARPTPPMAGEQYTSRKVKFQDFDVYEQPSRVSSRTSSRQSRRPSRPSSRQGGWNPSPIPSARPSSHPFARRGGFRNLALVN
jgi:hypothetical protein